MPSPEKTETAPIGSGETTPTPPLPPPSAATPILKEDWLHDFYKECGREVTLAYTTLNQMKNWAIIVQAAIISAVVAFGKNLQGSPSLNSPVTFGLAVIIGAVLCYVFTLRFFFRAILCYVNLYRWNNLQSAIIQLKLYPDPKKGAIAESDLCEKINNHYYRWLSPIGRQQQVVSNLKLGFGLLFSVPIVFLIWGGITQWDQAFARAFIVFAIGSTIIEVVDFLTFFHFDTPKVHASKKEHQATNFLAPTSRTSHIFYWLLNLTVATLFAFWPEISDFLSNWKCH